MKVLHVIDALGLGGGAEQALVAQMPLLAEHGIESSVVCLYPRDQGLFSDVLDMGIELHALNVAHWARAVPRLRSIIKESEPDLVHATLMHSCFATRLAMVGLATPQLNSIVNTTYDPARVRLLGINRRKLDLLRRWDALTARRLGGHFHALTQAVADEVIAELGVDPSRIAVIPRGRRKPPPDGPAVVRRELGIEADAPVVLTIGRQDSQKAQPLLIEACAKARGQHPDLSLLIAGRAGDDTPKIEAAREAVGGESWVHLLGHRTDVPDLFHAADCFALPSVYEGLGSVLIEAMAHGVPIVGSDAPAISEVLGEGDYGVVVPRGDVAALSGAIASLLSDPVRMAALASGASSRFAEVFEVDVVVEATADLYFRLAAE